MMIRTYIIKYYDSLRKELQFIMSSTKLQQLIAQIRTNPVYIQPHNYPDPDALASAKGLQVLLKHFQIESVICYNGCIDKCNTLQMIELLNIDVHSECNVNLKPEDEIILVDCQKGNTNVNDFVGTVIACIDHHKLQTTNNYRFFDIRSDVGSCSTIIANYFLENKIPINQEVATTLLYGLKMDTANLTRGVSNLDANIFCELHKVSSPSILRKLHSNSLTLSDLTSYVRAIENLHIVDSIGFANVGNNCSEAIIGTLSDFFLTLNEVHFVLVYSYRAGGLKFSVRSEIDCLDSARIIKELLDGFGNGGGHAIMAAGFVPNISSEAEAFLLASKLEKKCVAMIHSILNDQK